MFNEMLKGKRKAHGFTQQSFADLIGVSRQSVQKWESGVSFPEIERWAAIEMAFRFTVNIHNNNIVTVLSYS